MSQKSASEPTLGLVLERASGIARKYFRDNSPEVAGVVLPSSASLLCFASSVASSSNSIDSPSGDEEFYTAALLTQPPHV